MTLDRLRVFAVLGALAATAAARADDAAPPAVRDEAGLFDESAARQAAEELHNVGSLYHLHFLLQTVVAPPPEKQEQLKAAKNAVAKDKILRDSGAEEANKAGGDAVFILVCRDAVHGWVWTYGCVVVTVPDTARSDQFSEADARTLRERLRLVHAGNKAKNDAILLAAVAEVRDDLDYNHRPPFPWLGLGGVMAGVLGVWGVLALVRLRLRSADAAGPRERSGLFAALLGGMFGGAAGHWIYDTLFVVASRPKVPAEAAAPPPGAGAGRARGRRGAGPDGSRAAGLRGAGPPNGGTGRAGGEYMNLSDCPFCRKLADPAALPAEEVVWRFPHGVALLGTWQIYDGYCLLIARRHATELNGLDAEERRAYLDEMCLLARAIEDCFRPRKLNYELLGNQVPHLHWHLFPRYDGDPDARKPVWLALERAEHDAAERRRLETGPRERAATTAALRRRLQHLGAPTV